MSAYTWRERFQLSQRWVPRWGPLVAGVILLGWLGTAGKHTDVMAHLLGFGIGVLLGVVAALPAISRRLHDLPQWPAGLAATAIMVAAWGLALAN
jgi:membrane associated rhomboid family serine protease